MAKFEAFSWKEIRHVVKHGRASRFGKDRSLTESSAVESSGGVGFAVVAVVVHHLVV